MDGLRQPALEAVEEMRVGADEHPRGRVSPLDDAQDRRPGAVTLATSAGIVAQKRRELAEKRAEIEALDAYLAAIEAWIAKGGTGPKPAMPNTLGGNACATLEAPARSAPPLRRRAPAR